MISRIAAALARAAASAVLAVLALALISEACAQSYPARPITLIVPWNAGGGTDAVSRMLASLLEKDLGKPVNVVNRIGGGGVVGHQAIASAAPDGYTIGMVTTEIGMMHWQGLTKLTHADYTPIALVNADPAGVQVRADSPYKTLKDLVDAIKANPGKLKASGCGQGCIWHVSLYGLLRDLKVDPMTVPWVPAQGAAPSLLQLVAGTVDIVPCSVPEARSLMDAGKVRSLVVMDDERNPVFKDVPTTKQAVNSGWTISAWRIVAAPKGLPADIQQRLLQALKKAYDSKEYKDFMDGRGFRMVWAGPEQAAKLMVKSNNDMGGVMKAVGLAP
jgi:tripartite-type tricarboxylate transporter receptor subunit TctC